jgi:hypothetical protein
MVQFSPEGACDIPHVYWYTARPAGVAQSVEQLIRNEKVVGSIPISGTSISIISMTYKEIKPYPYISPY